MFFLGTSAIALCLNFIYLPMSQKYFLAILLATWWITVVIALPLWLPFLRTFPCIPAFSFIPIAPFSFHIFLLLIQFLASISLIISVEYCYRYFSLGVFLCSFLVLVLLDINRLQPYFYFEALLLIISVMSLPKENVIFTRIIFGGCYFWAGIHKINQFFVPSMTLLFQKTSFWAGDLGVNFLPFIPYIEIILGLAFLSTQHQTAKRIMYILAGLVHLSIILLLLVSNWNKIVIPWNIAMLLLIVGLHHTDTQQNIVKILSKKLIIICFILTVCLPFASFWGYWDNCLSWRLYSCKTPQLRWYATSVEELSKYVMPTLLNKYKIIQYDHSKKQYYIDLDVWLSAETHTLAYPEVRYINPTITQICNYHQTQKIPSQ